MKHNLEGGRINCLRKCRRARGLNQQEVAHILGFRSAAMISRWERGACFPESVNMLRLAIVYRTMVEALYLDLVRGLKVKILKREKEVLKSE